MNNTQSDTPRTDKWEYEQECNFDVPWEDRCRTLERELNAANAILEPLRILGKGDGERFEALLGEARKHPAYWIEAVELLEYDLNQLRSQNAELEKRVEEANKKGAYYRSLLYGCSAHGLWEGLSYIGCIEQERDSLKAQLAEAERKLRLQIVDSATMKLVEDLKAQLAEAVKDKERLDWFEQAVRNGIRPGEIYDSETGFQGWEWQGHKNPLFPNLRTAIDAAINQKP